MFIPYAEVNLSHFFYRNADVRDYNTLPPSSSTPMIIRCENDLSPLWDNTYYSVPLPLNPHIAISKNRWHTKSKACEILVLRTAPYVTNWILWYLVHHENIHNDLKSKACEIVLHTQGSSLWCLVLLTATKNDIRQTTQCCLYSVHFELLFSLPTKAGSKSLWSSLFRVFIRAFNKSEWP